MAKLLYRRRSILVATLATGASIGATSYGEVASVTGTVAPPDDNTLVRVKAIGGFFTTDVGGQTHITIQSAWLALWYQNGSPALWPDGLDAIAKGPLFSGNPLGLYNGSVFEGQASVWSNDLQARAQFSIPDDLGHRAIIGVYNGDSSAHSVTAATFVLEQQQSVFDEPVYDQS